MGRVLPTRDARLVVLVVGWIAAALLLDVGASLTEQRLIGVGTWLLLLAVLRRESLTTRAQVGVVVVFASVVEYVFAGWLGVYEYRLGNVPSFVPPGHGLVYLCALAGGRSAWAARHARPLVVTTFAACVGWALWGLALSDRSDALGAFWCACLLVFAARGGNALLYASAFLVVSYLELLGTGLGTWTWSTHDPTGLVSIGNPPSGIAGGYAFFDAAALAAAPWLLRRWSSRREAATATPASYDAAA